MVLYTADKLFIVSNLGLTDAGYYELGARVREIIGFFLASFFTVILPRGLEAYSRTGDRNSVLDLLYKPLAVNAYFYPVMMAVIIFWLPLFVRSVLTDFVPGIPSLVVLVAGGFFLALSYVPAGILVVLGKQKKLLYLLIGSITIYLAAVRLALVFQQDILWVAAAAVIAYFVYGTSVLFYTHYQFDRRPASFLRLAGHYLPGVYGLGLVYGLDRLFAAVGPGLTPWPRAVAETLAFLLCYSPVLIRADRKLGILTELFSMLKKKPSTEDFRSTGETAE
jgi:O-antigen/teichoic acid export membrane protein